jgi:small subunit ribosomal protein S20e
MKVNINMASLEEKSIEKASDEFYNFGKVLIPGFMPVEILPKQTGEITTLRTPCGQGTKTWSRYKIFVFLRRFCLEANHQQLEEVVQFLRKFSNVEIDLTIQN